ncbi:MAG: nuclease-related domain-containing protein [bacterium]|nr:nuclease-related domain-containing protein [bacterium]
MRIETNTALIRRMKQIAQYLFFGSFGVLIAWLIISTQTISNPETADNTFLTVFLPSILLPLAFIASMVSVRFTNLWIRQPRPEEMIRQNLKGISNRSVLYNYFHFPARHVLITPRGVYALVTRFQDGRYSVEGSAWKSYKSPLNRLFSVFRFDGIGNPSDEAQRAAAHIEAKLAGIAPGLAVQPVIVFVDPRARVDVVQSDVPVVFTDGKDVLTLKEYLREEARHSGDKKHDVLSAEQIAAFEAATLKR